MVGDTLACMRLTLDLDLDALGGDAAAEAGRILRYWAGAMGQMDLTQPTRHDLMDSSYQEVGTIAVGDATDPTGDVKAWLRGYLVRLHETLLWKIDGLGERDARWPMTPTGTNLLGLLKHVASVESEYFGLVVERPFPEELPWSAEDAAPNADMWAWPEESIGSVRSFAERVWAHGEATIDALDLGAPAHVPWWGDDGDTTFARILVHVIAETARHVGHADILRELTDGERGLSQQWSNLPGEDAVWWVDYVEKLKRVAIEAEASAPPSDGGGGGHGDAVARDEADIKHWLQHYLHRLHETLLWKLDGLSEREVRWPMTPTGTNLLGTLKHVASIEAGYLGESVGRPFPEELPWFADDAEPNADRWATPAESIAWVRAFAERVWAHVDVTVDTLPLDAPADVPWWGDAGRTTFGRVLVHVIDDVARHAGQADVVRELTDGAVGTAVGTANMPPGDAQWWSDYVERLKRVAESAE